MPLVFREGHGTPLQYSCLENPMDGGAWQAAVHRVATSQTRLSDFTFTFHFHALEKEMATHSSVLAWRIPGMGEPSGLPSMGGTELDMTQQQQHICYQGSLLGLILKDNQNTFDSTLGPWLRQKHTWKISPALHNATKGFQRQKRII